MISIIVPVHDINATAIKCLARIDESASGQYEVIAVCDFEEDLISNTEIGLSNVDLIANTKIKGPAGARACGAQKAKGDILLFIDSDIFITKSTYDRVVYDFGPEDIHAIYGVYSNVFKNENFFSDYKNLYWHYNQICLDDDSYSINTALFAIRRDVYFEAGGFNLSSVIGEDREFGLKLAELNKKVRHDKQLIAEHCKYFSFRSLLTHHFVNTVNMMILTLRRRGRQIKQKDFKGAGKNQIKAIVISGLVVILPPVFYITRINLIIMLCMMFCIYYVFLIYPFVKFCYQKRGLKFAVQAISMGFMENLCAFVGVITGAFRYYILRHTSLNFKIGQA